jgi:molybdopterin converting factor small subunit
MKVYVLLYKSYSYYENETTNSIKVFADKDSALQYFAILKEQLVDNALEELNFKTVQELEESYENDSEYIYSYINEDDYYYIDIEDWGTDTLSILEEDVMTF